jgi:hypothetical protein
MVSVISLRRKKRYLCRVERKRWGGEREREREREIEREREMGEKRLH